MDLIYKIQILFVQTYFLRPDILGLNDLFSIFFQRSTFFNEEYLRVGHFSFALKQIFLVTQYFSISSQKTTWQLFPIVGICLLRQKLRLLSVPLVKFFPYSCSQVHSCSTTYFTVAQSPFPRVILSMIFQKKQNYDSL